MLSTNRLQLHWNEAAQLAPLVVNSFPCSIQETNLYCIIRSYSLKALRSKAFLFQAILENAFLPANDWAFRWLDFFGSRINSLARSHRAHNDIAHWNSLFKVRMNSGGSKTAKKNYHSKIVTTYLAGCILLARGVNLNEEQIHFIAEACSLEPGYFCED